MALDPIPEEVRLYLREHFQTVTDEPSTPDYYVFSVTVQGVRREITVHRNFFMFPDVVPGYLRDIDIARQLETGNVEICEPTR